MSEEIKPFNAKEEIEKLLEENKIFFTKNGVTYEQLNAVGLAPLLFNELKKFLEQKKDNGYYIIEIKNPETKQEYNTEIKYEGGKEPKVEKEGNKERGEITLLNKFSPVPYAEILLGETNFIYDKRKQFFRYDKTEGIWRIDAEQYIRTELRKRLMGDEAQKKYFADEVISYIKDISYKENFEFKKNPHIIAFKNKVFDLKKDCFVEFSPEHYITNKLNIELNDEKKECHKIDKFLRECLDEEHKIILYEIGAYCLYTDYPYQKIFFIFGPANTAKSIFLLLLSEFLGKRNICAVEPRTIQLDKHSTYKMWLKFANIVSDINYNDFENVNQIKKLTGGDFVPIRPMWNEGFDDVLYAKQIYSTNKLPAVKEKTMAWYRRIYPIPFSNIIPPEKVNRFMLDEITTKEELQGFAFQCLEYLRGLYKNKFVFTYDINEKKLPALYENLSNPVLMFIDENCIKDKDGFCFKWEFDERLNNWLPAHHFPPLAKSQINEYMREHYNESQRPSSTWQDGKFNDKTYRVWTGLRWKNKEEYGSNFTDLTNLHTFSKGYYILRGSLNTPVNPLSPLNSFTDEEIKQAGYTKEQLEEVLKKEQN